jgi:A/G-specific adenine glycosylase
MNLFLVYHFGGMIVKKNLKQMLDDFHIEQFQDDLIDWFTKEQRDLPWRKERDPYKIWVSEIMLQQTRVDTVIPYFHKFMEKFPTLESLAEADEEEVLKAWEGLGYYSRVRNLHAAVKEVREKYGGEVPRSKEQFSKLKGVGPYTTGAVLSIAYGIPEPAVDGNVMRVLSRIFLIWDDIAKASTRKLFEEMIRVIISRENPSYFNQALMELGALICTPVNPLCLLCPVQAHCRAFHEGVEKELPVKTQTKTTKKVYIHAAVLTNEEGRILIRKRPSEGLLANLWEFPNVELLSQTETAQAFAEWISHEHNVVVQSLESIGEFEHVFSHLVWDITAYKGEVIGQTTESETSKWVIPEQLETYAFPVSHQRIWKAYNEKR